MTDIVKKRKSKTHFANASNAANQSSNPSIVVMDEITKATVSSLRKDLRDAVARDLRILKRHGLLP